MKVYEMDGSEWKLMKWMKVDKMGEHWTWMNAQNCPVKFTCHFLNPHCICPTILPLINLYIFFCPFKSLLVTQSNLKKWCGGTRYTSIWDGIIFPILLILPSASYSYFLEKNRPLWSYIHPQLSSWMRQSIGHQCVSFFLIYCPQSFSGGGLYF